MTKTAISSSLGLTLWRQTWPMAIGVLALLGFQLVDSAFIARPGTAPLAAQSFTFPLSFLIIGVQVGLGIAIAALISRTLGAGEQARARRLGSLVLLAGSGLIALLALLLWLCQVPVFARLGADAATLGLIRAYWAPQLLAAWLGAALLGSEGLLSALLLAAVPLPASAAPQVPDPQRVETRPPHLPLDGTQREAAAAQPEDERRRPRGVFPDRLETVTEPVHDGRRPGAARFEGRKSVGAEENGGHGLLVTSRAPASTVTSSWSWRTKAAAASTSTG